jgi:hypothetical protein
MINYALKQKVNDCLLYAETLTTQGYGAEGQLSIREMLKFDFLQFLGFLYESDGSDGKQEAEFIREYLNVYMTAEQFIRFRYDRCMSPDFINTVPRALTYFVKSDLSGNARRTSEGFSKSRYIVTIFNSLGQEFIALNGLTVTEVSNLSNYTIMLENYLKDFSLYNSGQPNEQIKLQDLQKNARANRSAAASRTANTAATAPKKPGEAGTPAPAPEDTETLEHLLEELNSLTGLEAVKQDITNLINLIKVKKLREARGMKQPSISLHLVFSGNPGTGKTTVARLLARIYKKLGVCKTGQLIEVDRSNLVEGYVGQTATKTTEVIESALGGVLFIDEAYTLTSNKGDKDFGQEAVDTLLKAMEDKRDELIVIVAGYTDLMEEFVNSNPGLKSRFNKYIFFQDYTGAQLTEIFKSMCDSQEYLLDEAAEQYVQDYLDLRVRAHEPNFANAREARNYMERCISRQASRIVEIEDIDDATIRTFTIEDVTETVPETSAASTEAD